MKHCRPKAKQCDILIIAEGTYPFVRGGVASWISEIIQALSHLTFGVIFLGTKPEDYKDYAYPLHNNVVHFQMVYLFEYSKRTVQHKNVSTNASACLNAFHQNLHDSHDTAIGLKTPLCNLNPLMQPETGFDLFQFRHSEASWQYIVEKYQELSSEPIFLNHFWNIRNMHEPLWNIQAALKDIPAAGVIHPVSTGYAGLLAVMIKQQQKRPIILSEHGIYTRERNIELLQMNTLNDSNKTLVTDKKMVSYQISLWMRFFASLARMTYHETHYIISLYDGAQRQQHIGGADPSKTLIIVNGVNIDAFKPLRRTLETGLEKVVCFVGRFVRIKDIKTFIRAIHLAHQQDADVRALIKMVGKPDENYLEECQQHINYLGLNGVISFLDDGGMADVLMKSRLLILSSISEGMPLVMLEALAAGVPVISTDVGACKGIIEGVGDEDIALGKAGAVVTITDARLLATEMLALLQDNEKWLKAQQAGIIRTERYYSQAHMLNNYQSLYSELLAWQE
jgi:glycosyltransferase involved in cell wall biosynthesis